MKQHVPFSRWRYVIVNKTSPTELTCGALTENSRTKCNSRMAKVTIEDKQGYFDYHDKPITAPYSTQSMHSTIPNSLLPPICKCATVLRRTSSIKVPASSYNQAGAGNSTFATFSLRPNTSSRITGSLHLCNSLHDFRTWSFTRMRPMPVDKPQHRLAESFASTSRLGAKADPAKRKPASHITGVVNNVWHQPSLDV